MSLSGLLSLPFCQVAWCAFLGKEMHCTCRPRDTLFPIAHHVLFSYKVTMAQKALMTEVSPPHQKSGECCSMQRGSPEVTTGDSVGSTASLTQRLPEPQKQGPFIETLENSMMCQRRRPRPAAAHKELSCSSLLLW